MPAQTMKVTIARTTVQVPVMVDEETTLKLVEQVNDRIAAMQAHAARIDSQASALLAAYGFAADLHAAREDHAEETREVTLALQRLIDTLGEILDAAPDQK